MAKPTALQAHFSIKGISQFDSLLKKLPDQVQRRIVRTALMASAKPIVAAAKSNLAAHKRTGKGARTVKARSLKRGGGFGLGSKAVMVAVSATTDAFYLRFLENGSVRQSPSPWLRPAVDANTGQQRKILADELRIRILKTATNLARLNKAI